MGATRSAAIDNCTGHVVLGLYQGEEAPNSLRSILVNVVHWGLQHDMKIYTI
jgi:hypothetical protein